MVLSSQLTKEIISTKEKKEGKEGKRKRKELKTTQTPKRTSKMKIKKNEAMIKQEEEAKQVKGFQKKSQSRTMKGGGIYGYLSDVTKNGTINTFIWHIEFYILQLDDFIEDFMLDFKRGLIHKFEKGKITTTTDFSIFTKHLINTIQCFIRWLTLVILGLGLHHFRLIYNFLKENILNVSNFAKLYNVVTNSAFFNDILGKVNKDLLNEKAHIIKNISGFANSVVQEYTKLYPIHNNNNNNYNETKRRYLEILDVVFEKHNMINMRNVFSETFERHIDICWNATYLSFLQLKDLVIGQKYITHLMDMFKPVADFKNMSAFATIIEPIIFVFKKFISRIKNVEGLWSKIQNPTPSLSNKIFYQGLSSLKHFYSEIQTIQNIALSREKIKQLIDETNEKLSDTLYMYNKLKHVAENIDFITPPKSTIVQNMITLKCLSLL